MRLAPMTAGFAALIAAVLAVGGSFAGAQEASRAVLDPKTAHVKAETGEIVLVDIRTPEEWRETGVPASAHAITMNQQPAAFLGALGSVAGSDKSKPIALICRTGNRSAHLAAELRKAGFTNIFRCRGRCRGRPQRIGLAPGRFAAAQRRRRARSACPGRCAMNAFVPEASP